MLDLTKGLVPYLMIDFQQERRRPFVSPRADTIEVVVVLSYEKGLLAIFLHNKTVRNCSLLVVWEVL